jgi:hypothetical protein
MAFGLGTVRVERLCSSFFRMEQLHSMFESKDGVALILRLIDRI